ANTVLLQAGTNTINATDPARNFTFQGTIAGTGNLAKGFPTLAGAVPSNSAGTLTLTAIETYSGLTAVNQGTLQLNQNGSLLASNGGYAVNAGATLTLDNTQGNNLNRLGGDVLVGTQAQQALTLAGGTLNYLGVPNNLSANPVSTE